MTPERFMEEVVFANPVLNFSTAYTSLIIPGESRFETLVVERDDLPVANDLPFADNIWDAMMR